jgi:hypothetical protein
MKFSCLLKIAFRKVPFCVARILSCIETVYIYRFIFHHLKLKVTRFSVELTVINYKFTKNIWFSYHSLMMMIKTFFLPLHCALENVYDYKGPRIP